VTHRLDENQTETPADDLSTAIAAAAPKRWWNRTTLALLGLALAAGGFVGGVQAQERWGATPTPAEPASRPGGTGGRSEGTSGTVKLVDGTTLYVQTAEGDTVTVRTSDTTTVRLAQATTLDTLTSGQQVTVVGESDGAGVVSATTVTAG
jgi:hypothetical protein